MNLLSPAMLGAGLLVSLQLPHLAQAQSPAAPTKVPVSIIITNGPVGGEGAKARSITPYLSTGISDIIRMVQAGVEEPVILAFVQSSSVAYHPTAREVIYLREVGVSQAVITALLKRGGELRDRAAEVEREERNRAPQPAPAPPPPETPPTASSSSSVAQPAQVVYTTPTYVASSPVYVGSPSYSYAAYSYPYAYGSCYPGYYGGYGYRSYPYYGRPYVGFGYGSGCGPSFSVGVGFGGYRGYGYGYGGYGYRHGGYGYGHGGYGYRHGGYRHGGYSHGGYRHGGYSHGIRYTGGYGRGRGR